jgi:glycosyltransferase involved in cell wall biosynthesis
MALGTPVIATGYSGNLDFMDESTAYLVPWEYANVGPGADPYPAGARWADPDLDAAAQLMARVAAHPSEAVATGRRARAHIEAHHGPTARAAFVRGRFDAIEAGRAAQLANATAATVPEGGPASRLGRLIGR